MKIKLFLFVMVFFTQMMAVAEIKNYNKYQKEKYRWTFGNDQEMARYMPEESDNYDPTIKGLVAAPEGWHTDPDAQSTSYAPQEITNGGVRLSISDLQENKDHLMPAQYLEQIIKEMEKNFNRDIPAGMATESLSHNKVKLKGDRATVAVKIIILGYPAISNITVYPVGNQQMRFIEFFIEDDTDLIQRYQGIANKMIEEQYVIDHAHKK